MQCCNILSLRYIQLDKESVLWKTFNKRILLNLSLLEKRGTNLQFKLSWEKSFSNNNTTKVYDVCGTQSITSTLFSNLITNIKKLPDITWWIINCILQVFVSLIHNCQEYHVISRCIDHSGKIRSVEEIKTWNFGKQ